ncbi:hypothetical protein AD945_00050, partial [Gluconobacter albidus]
MVKKIIYAFALAATAVSSAYANPSGMNWKNGQILTDTMLQRFDGLKANQQDLSNLSVQLGDKANAINGHLQNPVINQRAITSGPLQMSDIGSSLGVAALDAASA